MKRTEMMADAEQLAALWCGLAENRDFASLGRAMAVSKARLHAALTVMAGQPERHSAFQQALVAGLAAPQSRVRFECAHALDQFGDDGVRPALARLMDDPVPRVRWMAMHALSCHACGEKPGALEAEIRERIIDAAAHDPSPQVRRHAAVALGLAHETAGAPVLDAMLSREPDPKTRRMAGWARAELDRAAKAAPPGL
ncbi:MAG TPA: HEAT repeat domain-containing protein [Caulobacteraceae bacterium]|jgi:HEAT repeat protein